MDEDGFVSIMARSDDVINVAGHRLSTKALEEVRRDNRELSHQRLQRQRRHILRLLLVERGNISVQHVRHVL